ncbi:hypothetical protein D770_11240 [Flammeovirgaceae bacterium 311]|nr:hypothetical protein D770_11240 [Flammeovirgaceae bacterium 311]
MLLFYTAAILQIDLLLQAILLQPHPMRAIGLPAISLPATCAYPFFFSYLCIAKKEEAKRNTRSTSSIYYIQQT